MVPYFLNVKTVNITLKKIIAFNLWYLNKGFPQHLRDHTCLCVCPSVRFSSH